MKTHGDLHAVVAGRLGFEQRRRVAELRDLIGYLRRYEVRRVELHLGLLGEQRHQDQLHACVQNTHDWLKSNNRAARHHPIISYTRYNIYKLIIDT